MAGSWRSSASSGRRYWFHLHTVYTHGTSTVREYLESAREFAIEQVVFLEHVRRAPTYDPLAFASEIHVEAKRVRLEAFVGFEAKILPGGYLDIPDGLFETADVVGIAEHGYPGSADSLADDFVKLVTTLTAKYPQQSFVWVHPGSWLVRSGQRAAGYDYERMFDAALKADVRIERNLKYDLVSSVRFNELAQEVRVVGLDAHATRDARARQATFPDIVGRSDDVPAAPGGPGG